MFLLKTQLYNLTYIINLSLKRLNLFCSQGEEYYSTDHPAVARQVWSWRWQVTLDWASRFSTSPTPTWRTLSSRRGLLTCLATQYCCWRTLMLHSYPETRWPVWAQLMLDSLRSLWQVCSMLWTEWSLARPDCVSSPPTTLRDWTRRSSDLAEWMSR